MQDDDDPGSGMFVAQGHPDARSRTAAMEGK
jgi:hypothetical protein